MKGIVTNKDVLLSNFKRHRENFENTFSKEVSSVSDELMKILKEKELTYEEAYAALQLTYETLKHESNFIKIR